MKTIKAGAKYVSLFIMASLLLTIGLAGCGKDKDPEYTQVKIKVAPKDVSGEAKTLFEIDPGLHPRVAVVVEVTSSDLGKPIYYYFSPELVNDSSGILAFEVPSGQSRTFTPMALEFLEGEQPSNVFPGVKYSPTTSASQRTVDLTGEPVVLNISLMQEATTYLGGAISDDRTGTQAPIDNSCANPDVLVRFNIPFFRGQTVEIPVSVNTGGSYNISGVPMDLAIQIQARDATTGATGTQDINIPAGTTFFTQDVNLYGVTPLTLTPTSAVTEINGSVMFTPNGGIYPYVFSISPNISGAYIEPPATVFSGGTANYIAGATGGGSLDTVIVTDNCGMTDSANVTVNWPPFSILPTYASVAPYENTTFTAVGGSGSYSWGFSSQGCADSNIAPDTVLSYVGDYTAPTTGNCSDVITLTDLDASASVTATVDVGPDLQITPTSVMTYIGQTVDFDATGGKTPYSFVLTSDSTGGATVDSTTGVYTTGTSNGTSVVTVYDDTGMASQTGVVHVFYTPLVISPLNPAITFGESQMFACSGGNGSYNFSIINQGCSGSSISPTGYYMSPSSYECIDVIQLSDTAGTAPTSTEITVYAPPFTIKLDPPTSIFTDQEVALSVSALYLTNAGDTVRFEVVHDSNGNGTFDLDEPTIKMFDVADGSGAPVYSKEPYDMDETANTVISTTIPFFNPPHISGKYILLATETSSSDTDEAPFEILVNPMKPKIITGQVTSGANPMEDALVLLDPRTRKGGPLEWTWTDSSGNYTLRTSKTTGKLQVGALKQGYLMDMASAPVVDLVQTMNTANIDLTPTGALLIGGDVIDQTTAMGVPGILGIIRSENGRYASMTVTDTMGQFTFSVLPGNSWLYEIFPYWALEHGYVIKQKAPTLCNVNASTSFSTIYVNKGDNVITGGFSPATSVMAEIEMFDPANSLYGALYSRTVTDGSGNFEVPIVAGGTITVRVDPFSLGEAGILAYPQNVYTGTTPPFTAYFSVINPYYYIYGQLTDTSEGSVGGIPIFGYSSTGIEVAVVTDSSGNYQIGSQSLETWNIGPDNVFLMDNNYAATPKQNVYVSYYDTYNVDFETATSAANSKISGTVLDDVSSVAVENSVVTLWESVSTVFSEVIAVQTGCGGAYNLRAKQTATGYIISASAPMYMTEYWNEQPAEIDATPLVISPPTPLTDVNFTLTFFLPKPLFGKTTVCGYSADADCVYWEEINVACGAFDNGYNDPDCCAAFFDTGDQEFAECMQR